MPLRLLFTVPLLQLACVERVPETTTETTAETTAEQTTSGTTAPDSTTTDKTTSTGATTEGPTEATTAVTTEATTAETAGTTIGPDPDYVRECQHGDFKCDDWGCEAHTEYGQCYKRCSPASPDEVGEPHADCDEPERPFCSQVGLALGGDYDCNDCAFVCTAVQVYVCEPDFACQG